MVILGHGATWAPARWHVMTCAIDLCMFPRDDVDIGVRVAHMSVWKCTRHNDEEGKIAYGQHARSAV